MDLYVYLQCVFHSIRFKVNKGWVRALTLFLCPKVKNAIKNMLFRKKKRYFIPKKTKHLTA